MEKVDSVHEILAKKWKLKRNQVEILKDKRVCALSCFSHVRLFATLWTIAGQAPVSMRLSRQRYWSVLPCPPPGDPPDPGIEPCVSLHLLHWQAGSLPLAPPT